MESRDTNLTSINRISITNNTNTNIANTTTTNTTTTNSNFRRYDLEHKDHIVVGVLLGIYLTKKYELTQEQRDNIRKSLLYLYQNKSIEEPLLNETNESILRRKKFKILAMRWYTYVIFISHFYSMFSFLVYSVYFPQCCGVTDILVQNANVNSLYYNGTIITFLAFYNMLRGNEISGAMHNFLTTLYEVNLTSLLIIQINIFHTISRNGLAGTIINSLLSIPLFTYSMYKGDFYEYYAVSYAYVTKRMPQDMYIEYPFAKYIAYFTLLLMAILWFSQLPLAFVNIIIAIVGLSKINSNTLTLSFNSYVNSNNDDYYYDSWVRNNDPVCFYSLSDKSMTYDGGIIDSYCNSNESNGCCIWYVS